MNNYELISFLVEEIVKRLNIKNKLALVMFTGTEVYSNKIYEYVKNLKKDYSLKIFLSNSFEKSFDPNIIKNILEVDKIFLNSEIDNINILLKDVDTIIIPALSLNSLTKISLGMRDSNVSDICANAILKNIPITVLEEGCEANNISLNVNVNYRNMISKNIDILKTFGIEFVTINQSVVPYNVVSYKEEVVNNSGQLLSNVSIDDLNKVVNETISNSSDNSSNIINTNVLTRSQVMDFKQNGKDTILVSKNTKITLLAKDTAKELGVEIRCI